MKEYPTTLGEFEEQFGTEEACRDYLFNLRFRDGFVCPKCGGKKFWLIKETLYECGGCGHQTSLTAGTLFQDTHKPLTMWFRAIWWVTQQKNGTSALDLQKILGLGSYRTAWTWMHKLRRAMVRPHREKICGRVEIDETYIDGTEVVEKQRKETKNKALVVIAVEVAGKNKIGRIRMSVIKDATASSLHAFIERTVEKGSELITDKGNGYAGIANKGYAHKIADKYGKDDKLLPHVHLVVSLLKRWILGTLQGSLSARYTAYYLDEFIFRFNKRKFSRGLPFYRILEHAMMLDAITYNQIISK
jgi:transposase-like protein/ribosomal protein L37AE/L43A